MKREIGGFHNGYRLDKIDRRGFLRKLSLFTGATTAAIASHPLLDEKHARASEPAEEWPGQRTGNRDHADYYPEMVADDTGLITRFINYPGETGVIRAYLARP